MTNGIAAAQHEINKELAASKTMYEYLDEETRSLLFNQEDYNILSDELIDIQAEAEKLQRRYNQDILNATSDNLDEITSKYQMQYETLMKTYEIAKAELEVAKKRQQLDNVLKERNVRMFIDGQWQWVANTQDVINAQNEYADAQYQAQQSKLQKEQNDSINELTTASNKFTTTINEIDSGAIDLRDGVSEITSSLNKVADESVPALENVLSKTKNALRNFANSLDNDDSSGEYSGSVSPSGKQYYIASGIPGIEDGSAVAYVGANSSSNSGSSSSKRNAISANRSGINISSVYVKDKLAGGTNYTRPGNTFMGEEEPEIYIDSKGHLIPVVQPTVFKDIEAGGMVFNQAQMRDLRNLWNWSNIGFNSNNMPTMTERTQSISSIDNSIHINGITISEQGNEDWINGLKRYIATHK